MNGLKDLPATEEMVSLVKEMFESSTKGAARAMLRPHGLLLEENGDVVKFLGARSKNIMKDMEGSYNLRHFIKQVSETPQELSFASGVVWGYYDDEDMIGELWSHNDYHLTGMSQETIQACVKIVMELSIEHFEHVVNVGVDDMATHTQSCWLTGCYVGKYFLDLQKMMEGMG